MSASGRHPYACHNPCPLCRGRDIAAVRDAIAIRIEERADQQERQGHMRAADELRRAAKLARLELAEAAA